MKEKRTEKFWQVMRSEPGPDLGLFQARYDWLKNPRNDKTLKVVVLETADWVNVVAVTSAGKVLTVRQYRFGAAKNTLEIPAGLMERGETPLAAAKRELREETGYTSEKWEYLGWFQANPAFMNNICHAWLALDATQTLAPQLDEGEEIFIAELSLDEIREEIQLGNMRNALSLLALSQVFDLRQAGQDHDPGCAIAGQST